VPIARRFGLAQKAAFGPAAVERPIVELAADELAQLLIENEIDIVVNCVGVLQDGHRGSTDAVHCAFVARLLTVLGSTGEPALLIHLSIPGNREDDRTPFSNARRSV
jgi:hypothetical protein